MNILSTLLGIEYFYSTTEKKKIFKISTSMAMNIFP